jgi:hypothetical protein
VNAKKILGLIAIVGGVVLIGISSYIKNQVGEGQEKVAEAQKKIDQGQGLFGLSPVTKQIGQGAINKGQAKIASAKETIAHYQEVAEQLQIGGIALIVIGAAVMIIGREPKKKK